MSVLFGSRLTQIIHVGIIWQRVSPNSPSNGTLGGATTMSLGTVVSKRNFRNRGLSGSQRCRLTTAASSLLLLVGDF